MFRRLVTILVAPVVVVLASGCHRPPAPPSPRMELRAQPVPMPVPLSVATVTTGTSTPAGPGSASPKGRRIAPAAAGGNGDPYNGPHFSGYSIPVEGDVGITIQRMQGALRFCLAELNHRLLQQLFPNRYTLDDKSCRTETFIEPYVGRALLYRYVMFADVNWSFSVREEGREVPYRLTYFLEAGQGLALNSRAKMQRNGIDSFNLVVERLGAQPQKRRLHVWLGLPHLNFALDFHPVSDPKTGHLSAGRVLEFYHDQSISIMDSVDDAETRRPTGATINLREYYRCLEAEMFREGLK